MDLQIAATNRRQAEVRATANSYLTPDGGERTPDAWDLAITKAWADHPTQTAQAATPTAKPTATATATAKPTASRRRSRGTSLMAVMVFHQLTYSFITAAKRGQTRAHGLAKRRR